MGTQLGFGMSLLSLKTEWHKSLQSFRCLDYLELNELMHSLEDKEYLV